MARLPDFQVPLAPGALEQPPAAVVAASYGIGRQNLGPQRVAGTTDLALALNLVNGKLLAASGIDAEGDDTVPATFSLDRGSLAGFTVPLAELSPAIEAAGGELPAELVGLADLPGAITARFTDVGVPVDVQAPPTGERVRFQGAGDFEAAMKSCGES